MIAPKYSNFIVTASLAVVLASIARAQVPYIADDRFDFGDVPQGRVVEHRFMVSNPGPSTLAIGIAGMSHPGMNIRAPQKLPPGESGWITVTWDTRPVQGEMTAEVLLRLNETESAALRLSAKVVPPIDILPYPAVFISGFKDERSVRILEVVNNDKSPLSILDVSRGDGSSSERYSVTHSVVDFGRRYQVRIELKPGLRAGKFEDVLIIRTNHQRFPVIRIPVHLLVKDDVYANPDSLDFGRLNRGTRSPESFLLKARNGTIAVLSVTSDLPFLKVSMDTPDAASTHEFRVDIEGAAPSGSFSGSISIRTDDPSHPLVIVPVAGRFE